MSTLIEKKLLPLLREAFPDQRMEVALQADILAKFYSPSSEVGALEIRCDGDEVSIALAGRVHVDIDCDDEDLTEEQRADYITNEVLTFLRKLFGDEIEFYGFGVLGGYHERQGTTRGQLSKFVMGRTSYVWSGPLAASSAA